MRNRAKVEYSSVVSAFLPGHVHHKHPDLISNEIIKNKSSYNRGNYLIFGGNSLNHNFYDVDVKLFSCLCCRVVLQMINDQTKLKTPPLRMCIACSYFNWVFELQCAQLSMRGV